jgi:hypothetical protein
MHRPRGEQAQGTVEYVGVLALVALVVAALVAASGLPRQVSARLRTVVCDVVREPCADAGSGGEPEIQMLMSRPIAAASEYPWEPTDNWRDCPEGHLCLYADRWYRELIYSRPLDGPDPDLSLPEEARDQTESWVNNTGWDFCGENRYFWEYNQEVPLPSGGVGEGFNREGRMAGQSLDHIGTCDDIEVTPEPFGTERNSNGAAEDSPEDCIDALCFYADRGFGLRVYRISAQEWRDASRDDRTIPIDEEIGELVSGWANATTHEMCWVDEDGNEHPMFSQQWHRYHEPENGMSRAAQQPWMGEETDGEVRGVTECTAAPPGWEDWEGWDGWDDW